MKIIAINSSPRHNGNTNHLLQTFAERARELGAEVEIMNIGGGEIKSCRACGACRRIQNMECAFKDDIFNTVFKKLVEADAMIFGTPSYFSNMTPELKSLIDRAGYVAKGNNCAFRHKIGAGVIAQRRGGGTLILATINQMFLMSEMFVVGSNYWNFGNGALPGAVKEDEEAINNMKNLAENIVWLGQKIKGQNE